MDGLDHGAAALHPPHNVLQRCKGVLGNGRWCHARVANANATCSGKGGGDLGGRGEGERAGGEGEGGGEREGEGGGEVVRWMGEEGGRETEGRKEGHKERANGKSTRHKQFRVISAVGVSE